MTNDIESVPSIVACAAGRTPGGVLNFTFPEVLDAIKMCTSNNIAVLGIDVFEVRADGYLTKRLAAYSYDRETQQGLDDKLQEQGWPRYVRASNELAERFMGEYPAGDDHVYVLTTSSWREFCEVQRMKRQ